MHKVLEVGTCESGGRQETGVKMSEHITPTIQEIEHRAYEIYLARGGEEGRFMEDWIAAEKELTELSKQSASSTPRAHAATAGNQKTTIELRQRAGN
jgi:Protein of unknown function (DUF2934)